jgi:hypothetical protein
MSRIFSPFADQNVRSLLGTLVNEGTNSNNYTLAMYELGKSFGENIFSQIKEYYNSVSLVATVEDTDSLGKGIIDVLEKRDISVKLTVFWNQRSKPNRENNISIAPIIKEFTQKTDYRPKCLVIIKSIIANSCVVRTNLTRIIETEEPETIFVVAPVLLEGAIEKLESEFSPQVRSRFQYLYYAKDNDKTSDGIVVPGIGGDVYQRLGFGNQLDKNKHIPTLVKERRYS